MSEQKIVQVKKLKIKTALHGTGEFVCTFILICSDITAGENDSEVVVYKTSITVNSEDSHSVSGIIPALQSSEEGAEVQYPYFNTYAIVEKNHLSISGSKPMRFVRWLDLKEIIELAQQRINNTD